MSTGSTNDISPLLCFHFWEPVYYKLDDRATGQLNGIPGAMISDNFRMNTGMVDTVPLIIWLL
jgi:hypothetical protein